MLSPSCRKRAEEEKVWTENFNGMLSTSSSTSTHVNEISSFNGGIEELQHQSLPRSTSLDAGSVTELKIYGASILCLHAIRHKVKNFFKHFLNYGINSISRFLSASDAKPPTPSHRFDFVRLKKYLRSIPAERRWMKNHIAQQSSGEFAGVQLGKINFQHF